MSDRSAADSGDPVVAENVETLWSRRSPAWSWRQSSRNPTSVLQIDSVGKRRTSSALSTARISVQWSPGEAGLPPSAFALNGEAETVFHVEHRSGAGQKPTSLPGNSVIVAPVS